MKTFTIYHIPLWAFFSRNLYAQIGRDWKGSGLPYLLLLLACCWTVSASRLQHELQRTIDRELPTLADQMPTITIAGGKAHIEAPQPVLIRRPGEQTPFLILDTTGATTKLEAPETMALLTADRLITRHSPTETREMLLTSMGTTTVDRDTVIKIGARIKTYFIITLYPFMVVGSFLLRASQGALFAAFGLLIGPRLGAPLRFQALLRLAIAAMTPTILLKTLTMAFGYNALVLGPLGLVLATAYFLFGLRACAERPTETFPPRD